MEEKRYRINGMIRVPKVRLVGKDGGQMGVVGTKEAVHMARKAGLDLVEVSPNASPPVCKILDYGKYRFEQEKRHRTNRKNQRVVKLKEIRMQPKIDRHDLEFKTKHVADFLGMGSKVKITVRFRGRELMHTEMGNVVLDKVLNLLGDSCKIDKHPTMEGRNMSIIISPSNKN